jgi:hypothetical protein
MIRWLLGRLRPALPFPHHTVVPRPWRFYATHWTPYHGRGARR